jgi:hypothetical protein
MKIGDSAWHRMIDSWLQKQWQIQVGKLVQIVYPDEPWTRRVERRLNPRVGRVGYWNADLSGLPDPFTRLFIVPAPDAIEILEGLDIEPLSFARQVHDKGCGLTLAGKSMRNESRFLPDRKARAIRAAFTSPQYCATAKLGQGWTAAYAAALQRSGIMAPRNVVMLADYQHDRTTGEVVEQLAA